METAYTVIMAIWQVVLLMAPYLLLGFAVAGGLSVIVTPAWVSRNLGRRGVWQVVKASLLGVPLPLCSCGVLPLAFSLRRSGAGKGATVSFLASTPQTGVDSILLTWSLLGPVFAVARVVTAFVSGVLAGVLTDRFCSDDTHGEKVQAEGCCGCSGTPNDEPAGEAAAKILDSSAWRRALRHGFVTLPRDMSRPLLLGVLVSGAVAAMVPEGFFAGHMPPGLTSYALALLVGIPVYVCSASSVPIAVGFIHMGVSPGAAMVFLVAGPATNAAAVTAMWRQIGRAGTAYYLASIAAASLLAGFLLDTFFEGLRASLPTVQAACGHGEAHDAMTIWSVAAACLLVALLVPGMFKRGGD
ncbi:MAG: SO_0444 family Cu/Zn efflux transporter [Kiritimatiellae bacterium]|nr:SO_0444 family Cu/Zn efflux transporter [Kiritimatiellia bacterium]